MTLTALWTAKIQSVQASQHAQRVIAATARMTTMTVLWTVMTLIASGRTHASLSLALHTTSAWQRKDVTASLEWTAHSKLVMTITVSVKRLATRTKLVPASVFRS